MLRTSRLRFLQTTVICRDQGKPPTNVGPVVDDWTEGAAHNAKLPQDKGLMGYISKAAKQAKDDNELTKKLGIKGAIQHGRQKQAESMQKAQQAREAASRHMSLMKPGERLRALATGRYDPGSHFLMLDLDFEKDSLIFGTTRDEFYENVDKMKRVIVEYHRWERNDNFYMYGTRLLQFMTAFFIYDSWEQERFKILLASSFDNFKEAHEEEVEGIEQRRIQALERAVVELEVRPPNFIDLVAERKRVEEQTDEEALKQFKAHPMDTLQREKAAFEEDVARQRALIRNAISPTSVPAVKNLRRVLMPQANDWTVVVREEMLEYKLAKASAMTVPDREASEMPLGLKQQLVQPLFPTKAVSRSPPAASLQTAN
jgi:hypothetical protein